MKTFLSYITEVDTSHTFERETTLNNHLKSHGLVDKEETTAGSTGGQDFKITHPKTKKKVAGQEVPKIGGEVKDNIKGAKLGSVAIRYHKDKGWHIPESTKKAKPELSAAIENHEIVGSDGVKRKFFEHLNHHWGASEEGKHLPSVTTGPTDMAPAHAYMRDHGVDIVHIGDRGTFRAGHSHKDDRHNSGLPVLSGQGKFTVSTERKRTPEQQRNGTGMQVNFRAIPKTVPHSDVDISTDEGAKKLKRNMSK
jgi:hypothetical protein